MFRHASHGGDNSQDATILRNPDAVDVVIGGEVPESGTASLRHCNTLRRSTHRVDHGFDRCIRRERFRLSTRNSVARLRRRPLLLCRNLSKKGPTVLLHTFNKRVVPHRKHNCIRSATRINRRPQDVLG